MKRLLLLVPAVILTGCLASGITEDDLDSRFDPAQRLSPTAFEQNATMKDTSVHEDPSLMHVGVTRDQIAAAFGQPNETSDQTGQVQDVYEFNPDGSKFVKPKVYARNIAAGVFTGGIATVVHQARIHATEQQLTIYRLTYGPDGIVQSVQKESRQDDSSAGGSQTSPNP
jgi:outer membrane protein assembly factor BamE (lipoprotein component of BamABCDE complex)